MTASQLPHPDPLTIIVAVVIGVSLATGKTLNPIGFLRPMIIGRTDHPRLYWLQISMLGIFGVWSWLSPP